MAKNSNKLYMYKVEDEYVPSSKSELADKLMDKLEHQMKKMRYYRSKYHGEAYQA